MTPRSFTRHMERLGMTRAVFAMLTGLNLVSTVLEGLGIAIMLPVAELMISGGDPTALIAESRFWQALDRVYAFVSLEVNLAVLLISAFLLMLMRQAIVYLRAILTARVENTLKRDVRNEGLALYFRASADYLDHTSAGRFVNDLTIELGRAVGSIMSGIAIINYGVHSLAFLVLMLLLSAPMTLSVCVIAAAGVFLGRGLLRHTEMTGRQLVIDNQDMSAFLVERLRAVRLVRLSGMERAELEGLWQLTNRQRDSLIRLARLSAIAELVTEPVAIGMGLTLLFVGYGVFEMGLPEIGLFLLILLRLMPVVKTNILTWQSFVANMASLEAMVRTFHHMADAAEPNDGEAELFGLHDRIAFKEVSFQYRSAAEAPALTDLSVDFPAGCMTGLVGPSGSGKSTLIELLPRLREAQSGDILFDGQQITAFRRASLRTAIAFVPQSPQIFDVSPAQHIRYGKPDATDAEVERAAQLAGAHEFITALSEGYATPLGESGLRLSGGQRQRLDLARALVREAPILILDEPTSNLDADAEHEFREALKRIRRETETTMIIIGHRLSTIRDADQIVVLQNGTVTGSGTHAELLSRPGWYANAYAKQHDENLTGVTVAHAS